MPTVPTSNTVTMTVNLDKTASLSKGYVGAQGDAITFTVVVPAGLSGSGYDAYIDFIQPDGLSYFKGPYDCSSGTFNFSIGVSDSLMDKDGDLHWQFILAVTSGDSRTVKWASLKYKTKIYESVGATSSAVLPYVPQMVFPVAYPAANVSVASGLFTGATVEDALTELWGVSNTFVPIVRFGGASVGVTYSTQTGTYYRIGKMIFFQLSIVLTSKGSSTGNFEVGALPFTNARSPVGVIAGLQKVTYPASAEQINCRFNGASRNYVNFFAQLSADVYTVLTNAHVADDSIISVTGSYESE